MTNWSHTYEENGTDALGEYTVTAGGGARSGAWTLEGADASSFRLTGTGNEQDAQVQERPRLRNPMGGADDSTTPTR